jgi:hypothetical protein
VFSGMNWNRFDKPHATLGFDKQNQHSLAKSLRDACIKIV